MLDIPFQVVILFNKLFSVFRRRSAKVNTVVANTIEIETVTECILWRLSQRHMYDKQASKAFEDMAVVLGRLATVLMGQWERLVIHSDRYTSINIERAVQSRQKVWIKDLKAIFWYIHTRPLVLHDAIALCFQIDDRQRRFAEEIMDSKGMRMALTGESDPIPFFKSPAYKDALFTLARRDVFEYTQPQQ